MNHNIGSAVTQALSAHLRTCCLSNNFILFVYDIDPLDAVTRSLIHHP
jgi:hypothetical protein